ncbi:LOW QUALITY PROTEIN: hypothetical protein KUTeg_002134 [Tegillarca granosa]|uniref:Amidohydrolase-related domain-containing protein n=1 Tax=Tegillarca granosa TaxID=220873 RepID=A0ABQ9FX27_TEGGR|nr:LOW QUALITY PROTEIN: hypothetical protein KUTeg_002134 [Tegillarca granosa]
MKLFIVHFCHAGASTFPGFQKFIVEKSNCRVLCFLHIANHGLSSVAGTSGVWIRIVIDYSREKCPSFIVTKWLRHSALYPRSPPMLSSVRLLRVLKASELAKVPLMKSDVLNIYGRVIDIHTHSMSCVVDPVTRELYPDLIEVRERGVLFDVGHGQGSFCWTVTETAANQNFYQYIISTDMHAFNHAGPVYDLAAVMSKFLNICMPLVDVIRATTMHSARRKIGSLTVGKEADITVLRLNDVDLYLEDSQSQRRKLKKCILPVATWKKGILFEISKPEEFSNLQAMKENVKKKDKLVIKENEKLEIAWYHKGSWSYIKLLSTYHVVMTKLNNVDFTGDIAVKDGLIYSVKSNLEVNANSEFDATGASTFPGFQKFIVEKSNCRVLCFLHIANHGLSSVAGTSGVITNSKISDFFVIVFINTRVLKASELAKVPLMKSDVLNIYGRVIDIHTHSMSCVVDPVTRELYPDLIEVRERGVLFDVGHGPGSFCWTVTETAANQNFYQYIISTDMHAFNHAGPVYDLAAVMSKFLHICMPLVDVIRATTMHSARRKIGSLTVGKEADITVLRLNDVDLYLEDSQSQRRKLKKCIIPVATWKKGILFEISKPEEFSNLQAMKENVKKRINSLSKKMKNSSFNRALRFVTLL